MVARRIRNFAFILYEDSKPINWKERVLDLHIPGYYILHDKDDKKAHTHVLMTPEGGRSESNVKLILEHIGAPTESFREVKSLRGYARYLCHLDNPEKHRYNLDEVVNFCGANYKEYIGEENDLSITKEIIEYCRKNDVYSFSELVEYCLDNNAKWFEYLMCNFRSRAIIEYLKTKQWLRKN